ncbi:MAG: hypothetical protein ABI282_07940 [Candidatus Baltobacteraceae bacterium]
MRVLLQLRLLEMRKERLELAAAAVEHRLAIDMLLRELNGTPASSRAVTRPACKDEGLMR